jgi:hypothetical protein
MRNISILGYVAGRDVHLVTCWGSRIRSPRG